MGIICKINTTWTPLADLVHVSSSTPKEKNHMISFQPCSDWLAPKSFRQIELQWVSTTKISVISWSFSKFFWWNEGSIRVSSPDQREILNPSIGTQFLYYVSQNYRKLHLKCTLFIPRVVLTLLFFCDVFTVNMSPRSIFVSPNTTLELPLRVESNGRACGDRITAPFHNKGVLITKLKDAIMAERCDWEI